MSDGLWQTPPSWTWVILDDIAKWSSGGTPKSTESKFYGGDIPWLVIGDLNDGIVSSAAKSITKLGLENSSAKIVEKDSVLIAMYGSIGKLGIAGIECATNQAIAFTTSVSESITRRFLFLYLQASRQHLFDLGKGGAQANISQTVLKDFPICIPPLSEQSRIVAKLEEVLDRVVSSQKRLARILVILKRFRHAVLAAACSGRLTADWREENLQDEEWTAHRLSDLGTVSGGITKNGKRQDLNLQIPYLRVANVYENRLDLGEVKTIGVSKQELERTLLFKGDILFVEGNGSLDQIGRAAIWDGSISQCVHQNHLIKFRAGPDVIPAYVLLQMMSQDCRSQLIEKAISSAGLHSLSISKISGVVLPLPPLPEQQEIVRYGRSGPRGLLRPLNAVGALLPEVAHDNCRSAWQAALPSARFGGYSHFERIFILPLCGQIALSETPVAVDRPGSN